MQFTFEELALCSSIEEFIRCLCHDAEKKGRYYWELRPELKKDIEGADPKTQNCIYEFRIWNYQSSI